MRNKIKMWLIRNFIVLTQKEATELGLKFWRNVYGDERNRRDGQSIWLDAKGREYEVYGSVFTGGGFEMY